MILIFPLKKKKLEIKNAETFPFNLSVAPKRQKKTYACVFVVAIFLLSFYAFKLQLQN